MISFQLQNHHLRSRRFWKTSCIDPFEEVTFSFCIIILLSDPFQIWHLIFPTAWATHLVNSSKAGKRKTRHWAQMPRWNYFKLFHSLSDRLWWFWLKVRHFVRTWESNFGDSATPQVLLAALEKVKPKPQDIIDRISKNCLWTCIKDRNMNSVKVKCLINLLKNLTFNLLQNVILAVDLLPPSVLDYKET